MRDLTIYRYYFRDADCYQAAVEQQQRGVQVHCTTKGASYLRRWVGPDDGQLGQNRYGNHHNRPGGDVCAHAYIGKLADGTVACYQALPWHYRCWLSASGDNGNANRLGYIGFEIACDNMTDEAYFRAAVMGVSVNLTAHLLHQMSPMGTSPWEVLESYKQGDALAVMDHSELHRVKLASNHADISHWLKRYGLTMDDYRREVEQAMKEGVHVTYIDVEAPPRTLRKGDRGDDVKQLQARLDADPRYPTKVDGIFGADTEASVRAFQHDHGLTSDGSVGPKTWAALEASGAEDDEDSSLRQPEAESSLEREPMTVEERLTQLELAVFGVSFEPKGGESDG